MKSNPDLLKSFEIHALTTSSPLAPHVYCFFYFMPSSRALGGYS